MNKIVQVKSFAAIAAMAFAVTVGYVAQVCSVEIKHKNLEGPRGDDPGFICIESFSCTSELVYSFASRGMSRSTDQEAGTCIQSRNHTWLSSVVMSDSDFDPTDFIPDADFDPTDWNGTGHLWEPEPEPASELEEWNVFCRVANSYRGRFCDSDDEPDFEDALVDGLSPAPFPKSGWRNPHEEQACKVL